MSQIHAQTNSPAPVLPANRYLLVVETSHAMLRRSSGTLRAVDDMMKSRMRGQLRLNDSIGVWTFNETLYTGKLALQEWSEGERSAIDGKIIEFLQDQKYEKEGRLDKVVPALVQVVKNSEFITIILITEGSQDFHGTPYDQQINQLYKQWSAQQQKAHMPFITVLRARRGQFSNYSVTPVPWPVEMPPLPADLVKPTAPPSTPVVSVPKPAPPPMAQPLIISGRKPQPLPNLVAPTNTVVESQSPAPPSNSVPAQSAQDRQTAVSVITSAPPNVAVQLPSAVAGGTAPASSSSPGIDASLVDTSTKAPVKPPPEPTVAASPAPASGEVRPALDLSLSNSPSNKLDQTPATDNARATGPAPEIAAAPVLGASSRTKFVVIGLVMVVFATAAGIWIWKRRTRPASHISLITRSLDREDH